MIYADWFLSRAVLHQCNIVEFHRHAVIYRGAKGEGNVINLLQFRRNIAFLVYLPHSIAVVKFFGKLTGIPSQAGQQCASSLWTSFMDIGISSM